MVSDTGSAFAGLKKTLALKMKLCGADNEARKMLELSLALHEEVMHTWKQFVKYNGHLTLSTRYWIEQKIEATRQTLDRIGNLDSLSEIGSRDREHDRLERNSEHPHSEDNIQSAIRQIEFSRASLLAASPYLAEAMGQSSMKSPPSLPDTMTTNSHQMRLSSSPDARVLSKSKSSIDLRRPKKRTPSSFNIDTIQPENVLPELPPRPVTSQRSYPACIPDSSELSAGPSSGLNEQASSVASLPPSLPRSHPEVRNMTREPATKTKLPYPIYDDDEVLKHTRAAPPPYEKVVLVSELPGDICLPSSNHRPRRGQQVPPTLKPSLSPGKPTMKNSGLPSGAVSIAPSASEKIPSIVISAVGEKSLPMPPGSVSALKSSSIPLRRPKSRARITPTVPICEIHELPS